MRLSKLESFMESNKSICIFSVQLFCIKNSVLFPADSVELFLVFGNFKGFSYVSI